MPKGINITPELKELIVSTYKSGLTYKETADKLGISFSAVGKVVRESGYDRVHVGSSIARAIPVANVAPAQASTFKQPLYIMSRTLKLHSDITGNNYTVSTESDIIEIESDSTLMQLQVQLIDDFIQELQNIKSMLGNPS